MLNTQTSKSSGDNKSVGHRIHS